jgi:hypothetical protein
MDALSTGQSSQAAPTRSNLAEQYRLLELSFRRRIQPSLELQSPPREMPCEPADQNCEEDSAMPLLNVKPGSTPKVPSRLQQQSVTDVESQDYEERETRRQKAIHVLQDLITRASSRIQERHATDAAAADGEISAVFQSRSDGEEVAEPKESNDKLQKLLGRLTGSSRAMESVGQTSTYSEPRSEERDWSQGPIEFQRMNGDGVSGRSAGAAI